MDPAGLDISTLKSNGTNHEYPKQNTRVLPFSLTRRLNNHNLSTSSKLNVNHQPSRPFSLTGASTSTQSRNLSENVSIPHPPENTAAKRFIMPVASANASRPLTQRQPFAPQPRKKYLEEPGKQKPRDTHIPISLYPNSQRLPSSATGIGLLTTTDHSAPGLSQNQPQAQAQRQEELATEQNELVSDYHVPGCGIQDEPYSHRGQNTNFSREPERNYKVESDRESSPFRSQSHAHPHISLAHSTPNHKQIETRMPPPATPVPALTRSRSRSHSSASFRNTSGRGEDGEPMDFEAVMMRGMSEVRNVKAELFEQQRETVFLQTRLDSVTAEHARALSASRTELAETKRHLEAELTLVTAKAHAELMAVKERAKAEVDSAKEDTRRAQQETEREVEKAREELAAMAGKVEVAKGVARRGLDESARCYSDLRTAFQELKAQYDASQALMQDAVVELKEVKKQAQDGMRAIEPLLDEKVCYTKGVETKELIAELQEDCVSSHQVIDLLREKLHTLSSQLADAKERVGELETRQIAEGGDLERTSRRLVAVAESVTELAGALDKRERESIDSLAEAGRAELKLVAVEKRIEELTRELKGNELDLANARAVMEENAGLKSKLDESLSRISSLERTQQQTMEKLSISTNSLHIQQEHLSALKSDAASRKETCEKLETILQRAEVRCSESQAAAQKLRDELRTRELHERTALAKSEQMAEQVRVLEAEVTVLRKAIEEKEQKLSEIETKYTVMQERFEDQAVTLRLTKQQCGDLQDRLISSECSHATSLEAASGKLNLDIAVLQEKNSALQTNLKDLKDEAAQQRNAFIGASVEFENKLAQQEANTNRIIQAEERRAGCAEREAAEATKMAIDWKERARVVAVELEEVKKRAEECEKPSAEQIEEVRALKSRVTELEESNTELWRRARSLKRRHKEGDLDDDEKDFVNSLIQMSQAIHEQDIVSKGNELRRRDNTIASLQGKISVLESTLARHLQAKAQEAEGPQSKSMINLGGWVLSSPSGDGAEGSRDGGESSGNSDTRSSASVPPSIPRPPPATITIPPLHPISTAAGKPSAKSNKATALVATPRDSAPVQIAASALPVSSDPTAVNKPPISNKAGPSYPAPLAEAAAPRTTFTSLATEGSSELSEDDIPLSESFPVSLGKRARSSSLVKDERMGKPARPVRRLRAAANRKPESQSEISLQKPAEAPKPKPKKRR